MRRLLWQPMCQFKAETPCPKELYGEIHAMGLNALFPNVLTALRVFHTLPASVASNERSFRVLKRIKNYLRSNMAQKRINGLATLNINCDKARQYSQRRKPGNAFKSLSPFSIMHETYSTMSNVYVNVTQHSAK